MKLIRIAASDWGYFLYDFCDAVIKDTESSVLWNENSNYCNVYYRKLPIGPTLPRILSRKWDRFLFVERNSQPRASLARVLENCRLLHNTKDGKLQLLRECDMQQIPELHLNIGLGVFFPWKI